ncbi:MAG: TetR/AcrR family transcriptional regulator [Rhodopseudomonas sp.]|uniref:TetR/AcrR family transcriptional regulator n=1 Tax=Rhodopseudomonas sp. TaxID=1078 RepID=UPI0017FD3412|nr:WHG domain-containing protein [Rhodopseudomonas sp.]NVN84659.1 TetR/AcrR family transcriptional regulator [Rhodopseudomonas sp.]
MSTRPRATPTAAKAASKSTIKPAPKRAGKQPAGKPAEDAPYHHGALRDALLAAAERVLERDGLEGLTLRAVAREAGVSHAAPTHHFGDLTGLVSELAAIGFRRFNAELAAAGSIDGTASEKAMARAARYVACARAHPGMYQLMFRGERLDMTRPALHEASEAAFAGLAGAVAARLQTPIARETLTLEQAAEIARAWSMIHGFTTLLLDGRLTDILHRLPGVDAETLLGAMLKSAMRGA